MSESAISGSSSNAEVDDAVQIGLSNDPGRNVLKLDLEPYRWFRTNPIVRTAHLVAIADRLGVSRVSVRDALAPYDVFITRQLGHLGSEFLIDGLMEGLVADWRAWCSAA